MRKLARTLLHLSFLGVLGVVHAQSEGPAPDPRWIDRLHQGVYDTVWRSSMRIDHLFGAQYGSEVYQRGVSGSIAPMLLWDEFNHFKPRLRFSANVPLPQLNERFNVFIGRVNREELVTERGERSSSFRRQVDTTRDEQTIFGISYRAPPHQGWRFDGGAGVRLGFPMDPYVKGSYVYRHGAVEDLLFSFRQTGFWQQSERFGTTSRIDLERLFTGPWLLRWTNSGTVSQESEGVRGYSSVMGLRGFPGRRAFAVAVGFNGESNAEVPLQDYGFKVAWRQSVVRNWLVLELRTSLDWPREREEQRRESSWGIGIGFEMFFGTDEFFARPVTF
jgi:hypothetical protein